MDGQKIIYDLPFILCFFVFAVIIGVFLIEFVLADLLLGISFGAKFGGRVARNSVLGLNAVRVVDDIVQLLIDFLDRFEAALFIEILRVFGDHGLELRFLFPFVSLAVSVILEGVLDF